MDRKEKTRHCLKMKMPQKRGLHSFSLSRRNVSHLMQGKMGLVRVTPLKTQSLATGFGTVFLRSSQEGQPQKTASYTEKRTGFFQCSAPDFQT